MERGKTITLPIYKLFETDIGEHDDERCRLCGESTQFKRKFLIEHKPDCPLKGIPNSIPYVPLCSYRVFDEDNEIANTAIWQTYGSELAANFGTKGCGDPGYYDGHCWKHSKLNPDRPIGY